MNSEQYIAGAILISGEQVLGAIRGLVTAECFRLESCRAIFTAASRPIFIMLVKVVWRSSADSSSPVMRLSEMEQMASARLPV